MSLETVVYFTMLTGADKGRQLKTVLSTSDFVRRDPWQMRWYCASTMGMSLTADDVRVDRWGSIEADLELYPS